MTEIESVLREFIAKNFFAPNARGALDANAQLMEIGVLDSTGALELIGFLESEFDITIDDVDLTPENLGTIARITAYVAHKKGVA